MGADMARGGDTQEEKGRIDNGAAPPSDPIDQVRELLFGAAKRETSDNLRMIEEKISDMQADFQARVATLEARLADFARDAEKNQAASIDAIGGAIAQLGATIQNLSTKRKG